MFGSPEIKTCRLQLFHPKPNPPPLAVELEYLSFHNLTRLQQFFRMVDALLASDIADVDHALNTVAEIDEYAEVRQISDWGLDDRSDRILCLRVLPRITESLLQTERNALFSRIH